MNTATDRIDWSRAVHDAIARGLEADDKTREPINALVVWTELGRALAGTLDRKGADVGLLGRLVDRWCTDEGAAPEVALERWAYRLEPERRLTARELGATLGRLEEAVATAVAALARESGDDGGRSVFVAVARGWFPLGLELIDAFPGARAASREDKLGALRSWCERYLPKDPAGPADLGVRVERGEPEPE